MRPESEESKYRAGRRKQYFENPKYRKWSDIIDKTNRSYGTYRERAFLRLYLDCNEVSDNLSLSKMHETSVVNIQKVTIMKSDYLTDWIFSQVQSNCMSVILKTFILEVVSGFWSNN